MKNQAGPAQHPWPPKPSRSGPGPLAPQAKPVRPRTLGPPSQAGPAQDPWPPKPSRPGPGPFGPQAKPVRPKTHSWKATRSDANRQYNSIGNTIGNTIGNCIN